MFKNNSYGFYTSLFIENIIRLYRESGKVNYRTNDFFRKIFRTHFMSPCRNHSPEQKINHKNKSGTECTALQRVLFIYLFIFTLFYMGCTISHAYTFKKVK